MYFAQPQLHPSPSVAYLTLTTAEHVWQPFPGLDWCPFSILCLEQLVVLPTVAFLAAVDTTGRGCWEEHGGDTQTTAASWKNQI